MPSGGQVVITQDKVEADGTVTHSTGKADRADYNAITGDITLIGWPEVRQGLSSTVATEEGTILILNRAGVMRAKGRTKSLLVDAEKNPKQTVILPEAPAAGAAHRETARSADARSSSKSTAAAPW